MNDQTIQRRSPPKITRGDRLASVALAAISTALMVSHAHAQTTMTDQAPPVHTAVDANGVDMISGNLTINDLQVSIGTPGKGGLSRVFFGINGAGDSARDNLTGTINSSGTSYTVSIGSSSRIFTLTSGVFVNTQGDGSSLVQTNSTTYTFTDRDGSVSTFSTAYATTTLLLANVAQIVTLQHPDGQIDTYTYRAFGSTGAIGYRIQAVANNLGYEIKYNYQTSTGAYTDAVIAQILAINNAYDYCDPNANSCTGLTYTWPSVTGSSSGYVFTDNLGRQTTYSYPSLSGQATIKRPSGETWTYDYDSSGRVNGISNGTNTWSYKYPKGTTANTTTSTDANGNTHSVTYSLTTFLESADTDGAGDTTSYTYDTYGRITRITKPEGSSTTDYIAYTYDARGNVTQKQVVGTDGTSTITTTAGYDSTCTIPVKCNHPNWTKDSLGNETDYVYDSTSNLIQSISSPQGANGLRPEHFVLYGSYYAWYKNAAGTIVQAATPVFRANATSDCITAQACLGSVNATESSTSYGTTGVANNLLATATTLRAGDSSLTSTSSLTYDPFGNVLTATDPLGNTTRYRYDTMRELVGVVGPNPNGAGQTLNRAVRITYGNLDGLQTLVERGTVASQSDADWANFSTLAQQATTYDGIDRAVTVALSSGGTTTSLIQYSYDAANRLTCSAQRMNPAAFTSLPASACTLGTLGTYGYDRITMASYDAANRPLSSISGYGTSSQRTDETVTYGKDGEILTQADAKGNLTTLSHNPFNWVYRIYYPTPSNGAVSSTTDYEQYSYDTNGNLTQDRRRDGSVINYGYDANNLRISGANGATFNYDNIRRMTSAVVNGLTTTFTYDALGRVVTEAEPLGNVLSQYDAAGNLTKLTWPDGFYETYGYDSEGELQNVVESTGYAPTAYYYDSLGRPSAIGRSNQTDTYYTYGSNMALSVLTQSIGSSSVTYNYTYNPAGQVISSTTTQPAYDWVSGTQIDRSYAVDGQNKYTTSGTAGLSYDGRGNLTSDSVTSYGYDVNNHLTNLSTGATLTYDALQRLYEVVGSSTTLFVYAGSRIIAEYDGSENLLRRYAPGPSQEPVAVWYEGTDTATRRRLVEDRLGSTIGITTEAGALLAINTYDEFGIPAAGESGRFQFQGMAWIPEAGLYQTPARSYSPTLGRFMQSDPIGYRDGMNFYNFVHSDPINQADPLGFLAACGSFDFTYTADGSGAWSGGAPIGTCQKPDLGGVTFEGGTTPNQSSPDAPQPQPQPQSNTKSGACSAAAQRLSNLGNQLSQFGTALQLEGLVIGGLGLLGSEVGGEALLPGAVGFGNAGTAFSTIGSGVQGYAKGGPLPAFTNAAFSVVTNFGTNRLTAGALGALLGKDALTQAKNAISQLSGALGSFQQSCGPN